MKEDSDYFLTSKERFYDCCLKTWEIKGHKKPDCRYYKAELERKKNTSDKKKQDSENDAHNNFQDKDKDKANVGL